MKKNSPFIFLFSTAFFLTLSSLNAALYPLLFKIANRADGGDRWMLVLCMYSKPTPYDASDYEATRQFIELQHKIEQPPVMYLLHSPNDESSENEKKVCELFKTAIDRPREVEAINTLPPLDALTDDEKVLNCVWPYEDRKSLFFHRLARALFHKNNALLDAEPFMKPLAERARTHLEESNIVVLAKTHPNNVVEAMKRITLNNATISAVNHRIDLDDWDTADVPLRIVPYGQSLALLRSNSEGAPLSLTEPVDKVHQLIVTFARQLPLHARGILTSVIPPLPPSPSPETITPEVTGTSPSSAASTSSVASESHVLPAPLLTCASCPSTKITGKCPRCSRRYCSVGCLFKDREHPCAD